MSRDRCGLRRTVLFEFRGLTWNPSEFMSSNSFACPRDYLRPTAPLRPQHALKHQRAGEVENISWYSTCLFGNNSYLCNIIANLKQKNYVQGRYSQRN